MVKAKEFWSFLTTDLDYRYFSGVPCKGLKPLYDTMNSKFLWYVPAAKENIALGLVNGVYLSGMKGGILIELNRIYNIVDWLISFSFEYKIPFLVIAYDGGGNDNIRKVLSLYKIPYKNFSAELKNLKFIINKIEKLSIPGVCIIGKGEIER